jgi:UDP-2-acetamido-3-amino-2,3-dideoxy-glucuronate N-acetyltransferase
VNIGAEESACRKNVMNEKEMRSGSGQGNEKASDCHIHCTAHIDKGAEIGHNTKIWHFSHVMQGAKIGNDCVIGQNVFIGKDVHIGNGCKIQNNASLFSGVTLGDSVFIGPSVTFTNVVRPRAFLSGKFQNTVIKQGATIGANATILCGITIGKYAFVGAGAVVLEDVSDYALAAGTPAKRKGWVCECGNRLLNLDFYGTTQCEICHKKYRLNTIDRRKDIARPQS